MGQPGEAQILDKSDIDVKHLSHLTDKIARKNCLHNSYFTKIHLKNLDYVIPEYDLFCIMVYGLVFCVMVCVLVPAHRP